MARQAMHRRRFETAKTMVDKNTNKHVGTAEQCTHHPEFLQVDGAISFRVHLQKRVLAIRKAQRRCRGGTGEDQSEAAIETAETTTPRETALRMTRLRRSRWPITNSITSKHDQCIRTRGAKTHTRNRAHSPPPPHCTYSRHSTALHGTLSCLIPSRSS